MRFDRSWQDLLEMKMLNVKTTIIIALLGDSGGFINLKVHFWLAKWAQWKRAHARTGFAAWVHDIELNANVYINWQRYIV